MRIGEGAFLMAEKFAFNEIRRQCGTIHFYQGPILAGTQAVNRARHQFFAGSGFAENQDIGIRGGDLLDLVKHIFDFVALADNVFMVEFQFDLFLKVGSLGFELVVSCLISFFCQMFAV
jgi:hypothetical protein